MKLLVEIDVDIFDKDYFGDFVECICDYDIINDDEWHRYRDYNNDFYYEFGDEVNKVIDEKLKGSNNIGVIKEWRIN